MSQRRVATCFATYPDRHRNAFPCWCSPIVLPRKPEERLRWARAGARGGSSHVHDNPNVLAHLIDWHLQARGDDSLPETEAA
jgi:hypothetical protein